MKRRQPSAVAGIAVVIAVFVTVLSGAVFTAAYLADRSVRIKALHAKAGLAVDLLSEGLALPIWNYDKDRLAKALDNAMEDSDVGSVAVRFADKPGIVIGRKRDVQWKAVPFEGENQPTDGMIVEERSITAGSEKIGSVKLAVTSAFVEARLSKDLVKMAAVFLAADLILILGLTLIAWRHILKPAREMEKYLLAIGTGRKEDAPEGKTFRFKGEMANLKSSLDKLVFMLENRHAQHLKNEEGLRMSERARAEEELRKTKEEMEILMVGRVSEVQKANDGLKAELAEQRNMVEELRKSMDELLRAREEQLRFRDQLLASKDELERALSERTVELRSMDERLQGEISGHKRTENEFFRSREELERSLTERTVELESVQEKTRLELAEHRQSEEKLLKSREELEQSLTGRLVGMQRANEELQAEVSKCRRLEEELVKSREELEYIQGVRVAGLEESRKKLEEDLARQRRLGEELIWAKNETEKVLTERADALKEMVERVEAELAAQKTTVAGLRSTNEELERTISAKQAEISALGGKLEAETEERKRLEGLIMKTKMEARRVTGLKPGQAWQKVLVADDDEESRTMIMKILAPLEFEIREQDNGEDAVWEFEAWHPSLLIIDLNMQGVDGLEAMGRIRASAGGKNLKIVATGTGISEEKRLKALRSGADGFLFKPFRDSELFEVIGSLLELEYLYAEED